MRTQSISASVDNGGRRRQDDRTTEAERRWSLTHGRAFVIGIIVCLVGFWVPVMIGVSLWLSR